MWQSVNDNSGQVQQQPNPLDAIRQNQTQPQQGGILNGQHPARESDEDSIWKGIISADRVANKLP